MKYNVFSGTLNPTQSVNQPRHDRYLVMLSWNRLPSPQDKSFAWLDRTVMCVRHIV